MPKNLPDHCLRHCHSHVNIGHDLTLNIGSCPLLSKKSYIKVACTSTFELCCTNGTLDQEIVPITPHWVFYIQTHFIFSCPKGIVEFLFFFILKAKLVSTPLANQKSLWRPLTCSKVSFIQTIIPPTMHQDLTKHGKDVWNEETQNHNPRTHFDPLKIFIFSIDS